MQNPKEVLHLCINKTKKIMKTVTLFILHHEQDHFERACEDLDVPFTYIGEHAGTYSEHYAKYSLDITNPATLFSIGKLTQQYQGS